MKGCLMVIMIFFICFSCVLPLISRSDSLLSADQQTDPIYPGMQFTREEKQDHYQSYQNAKVWNALSYLSSDTTFNIDHDLLSYLDYVPEERDQGDCGNCWAWASTGVLEIALQVQENIRDRLSLQYLNSCQYDIIGKVCCMGGWPQDVVDFYSITGKVIPWSNINADWQDADADCDIACVSIEKDPSYGVTNLYEETITTFDVDQQTAIDNIKSVLHENKGVIFAYYLPDWPSWLDFNYFWATYDESIVYDMDQFAAIDYNFGPGHAVLCVGYHDEAGSDNDYWIMLNSWGTADGVRPNGLFRVNMNMDYSCWYPGDFMQSFLWSTLTVAYDIEFSVYDVNKNGRVDFQDAGLVWTHRTSITSYDPLYDVNSDGKVSYQDAGLVWIHRD